jgi:hypothetical protein
MLKVIKSTAWLLLLSFINCKSISPKGVKQVQVSRLDPNGDEMLSAHEADLLNSLLEKS